MFLLTIHLRPTKLVHEVNFDSCQSCSVSSYCMCGLPAFVPLLHCIRLAPMALVLANRHERARERDILRGSVVDSYTEQRLYPKPVYKLFPLTGVHLSIA